MSGYLLIDCQDEMMMTAVCGGISGVCSDGYGRSDVTSGISATAGDFSGSLLCWKFFLADGDFLVQYGRYG